ncbi:unnamed protein product [Symbiodinium sp. CCMP2592]|nr:unnamed protein product [Symbiodinium sp. CCMP2592]
MRARFTALRFKDPQFLAATEKEEGTSIKKRAAGWAKTLGMEEKSWVDSLTTLFASEAEGLREPVNFEAARRALLFPCFCPFPDSGLGRRGDRGVQDPVSQWEDAARAQPLPEGPQMGLRLQRRFGLRRMEVSCRTPTPPNHPQPLQSPKMFKECTLLQSPLKAPQRPAEPLPRSFRSRRHSHHSRTRPHPAERRGGSAKFSQREPQIFTPSRGPRGKETPTHSTAVLRSSAVICVA